MLVGIFAVLVLSLAWAAVGTPTGLTFEQNASSNYDEGNFSVNWSAAAEAVNYTIFIYADGVLYNSSTNDSALGYSFNNWTEANYTFTIQAANATGDLANSSNISMQVDRTGPVITLPEYTNATLKNNTDTLTLNISVNDSLSGETGSVCVIDVNGTNQTVAVSSNWCNSSAINLTGMSDGNNTITVYVNDTINNWGLNDSFVVWMDSADPTATASCSPSSVETGETVTCTCSGSDGDGSGINASLTTPGSTPSTSTAGDFTYTCSVTDNMGNTDNDTASYTVTSPSSSSGGIAYPTYSPSAEKLTEGYDISLGENYKVSFAVSGEDHTLKVDDISSGKVTITISSDPVTFKLSEGESENVDLDGDNVYDLRVLLKGITTSRANLVLTSISSEKPAEEESVVEEKEPAQQTEAETEPTVEKKGYWGYVIAIVVLLLVVAGIIFRKQFRKQ